MYRFYVILLPSYSCFFFLTYLKFWKNGTLWRPFNIHEHYLINFTDDSLGTLVNIRFIEEVDKFLIMNKNEAAYLSSWMGHGHEILATSHLCYI